MKNFVMSCIKGTYSLHNHQGTEVQSFSKYMMFIKRRDLAETTKRAYAYRVANFIDYMKECELYPSCIPQEEAFLQYPKVLIGRVSEGESKSTLLLVSRSLDINQISVDSCKGSLAAVNSFLLFLKDYRIDEDQVSYLRLEKIHKISSLKSSIEIANIKKHSGRISKRMRRDREKFIELAMGRSVKDEEFKDFPITHIMDVIRNAGTHRDKALYALLAGSGLRQHEALSIQLVDVDFNEQKLSLSKKLNTTIENTLPERMERRKGRTSNKIYVFEPFKTIFFDNIKIYLKSEYSFTSTHNYLFQVLAKNRYSMPLMSAANNSLNKLFYKSQIKSGMTELYPLHSLRHLFGVYMLNHIKIETEHGHMHGLPLHEVQTLMCHTSPEMTKRYARTEKSILLAKLEYADRQILDPYNVDTPLNKLIADDYRKYADLIEGIDDKQHK